MACAKGGHRNVIVIGKTGCGKSTLANHIICSSEEEETFPVARAYQSVTAGIKATIEHIKIGDKIYSIHMIDTVGFRDPSGSPEKSDANIMSDIKKHMRERAREGLNLIIFVYKNGRFSPEEKEVFKIISRNFKDYIKALSCLVITNCDGLNKAARDKVVSDFKTDAVTKEYAAMMTKGIYTVGLPRLSDLSDRMKEALIADMEEDIAPIRDVIAKSKELHLHDEMQQDAFWRRCTIL